MTRFDSIDRQCPASLFLVFDDRENVIDATITLFEALGVAYVATSSSEKVRECLIGSKLRVVAIIDKEIGLADRDGLDLALEWNALRDNIDWHVVTAYRLAAKDVPRLEQLNAQYHDKGVFDLQEFVEVQVSGNSYVSSGADAPLMKIEEIKERVFEARNRADSSSIKVKQQRKIWRLLAEPLCNQIMFDVEQMPCPEIEMSSVRAVIVGRRMTTDELKLEIENQTELGVDLVGSYMEVMQDLVYRFRGFLSEEDAPER